MSKAKASGNYRYVILLTLWLLYFINYWDRISVLTLLPLIREDLNLTHAEVGLAASIFFFAYAVAQLFAGHMADRFGAKIMMRIAITVFTAITFATGLIKNFVHFFIVRVALGLGEGQHWTPSMKVCADWFPAGEKGRATGLYTTSFTIGPAVAPIAATFIAAALGWRSVFFLLVIPGIIGIICLNRYIINKPFEALALGKISKGEYDYIEAGMPPPMGHQEKGVYGRVVADPVFWCYSLIFFFNLAVYWGNTTWISSFLYEQHKLKLSTMGMVAAVPFIVGALSQYLGGIMMDKFFKGRIKPILLISFIGCLPSYYIMSIIPQGNVPLLVTFFILIGFFANLNWGPFVAFIQIRYPREIVGTAAGISNFIGQFGAFLSPVIAGFLILKTESGSDYSNVFIFFTLCSLTAAIATLFLNEQPLTEKMSEK